MKTKKKSFDNINNPWAGLASYDDPEISERKLRFCGRDDESYDVAKLIKGNIFVTLYGKSGIGKTSLLNAGVFPELREEQFTPINIRLGVRDEKEPKSFQSVIIGEIERRVSRISEINIINEQTDQLAVDFLWNYFVRHRFYDKNDEPTSPVLVFDQFEEVFRYHRKDIDTFGNKMESEADILLRQIEYINDKDHFINNCDIDGSSYHYETNYRFVVSIREDDLYRLEDSIDNCFLPALKRCRYRLHSLSPQNASKAILIPGDSIFPRNEQERNSIVNKIIEYVSDKDGKISTNILSLICSQLYQNIQVQNVQIISLSHLDSFFYSNPIEKFYINAISKLSRSEKKYIETNLIDIAGRRNSVSSNDFRNYIKHQDDLINCPQAIFHTVDISSGDEGSRVELIHDKLAEVIVKKKKADELKIRYLLFSLITILVSAALIFLFLIFQNKKKEYIVEFCEDESISLTDYWKADVCILDNNDTIVAGTFDKSSSRIPFLYGKDGKLECRVHFTVGDIVDIKSIISLKDSSNFVIPISRASSRKRYEGTVVEKIQRSPIVDAIVIIGEQIKRTDKLGRFILYSDSTSVENDGKIRILRDGYKLYEGMVDDNTHVYALELNDYKSFKSNWNRLEKKLMGLDIHHYSGVIDDIVGATMYLGLEKDSVFGYFFINKFFDPQAKKKYLRYILLEGKVDSINKTFTMNSTDAVLNKCFYEGSFSNNEWMGVSRSYGNRTWTFSFHEDDGKESKGE